MLKFISHEITHLMLTNANFQYIYLSMKKKYLYSLLSTYLFAAVGASISAYNELNESENTAQPKKKQINKVYIYKKPELKLRIDTLNVSDDN